MQRFIDNLQGTCVAYFCFFGVFFFLSLSCSLDTDCNIIMILIKELEKNKIY